MALFGRRPLALGRRFAGWYEPDGLERSGDRGLEPVARIVLTWAAPSGRECYVNSRWSCAV